MTIDEPVSTLDPVQVLRGSNDCPPGRMLTIAPIVVRALHDNARRQPDGIEAGLARLCATWATDEGGAIIPAADMAAIFDAAAGSETGR